MRNVGQSLLLRRARPDDLDGLYRLALGAGHGLTNLPPDRDRLAERIAASTAPPGPCGLPSTVLFVLETGGEVGGVAAVWPRIGEGRPFYSYRIDEQAAACEPYDLAVSTRTLTLTTEFTGQTEVGGLLIDTALRGLAAGRLAARARYLFIAEHRAAFPDRVVAELRGWQDETGASPVWEALGRRFYALPFPEADRLSTHDHDFIGAMAPRHPVYLDLLPPEAQAAIGRPHDEGRAALKLLIEEGFEDQGHVDVFDAGPTVSAPIDQLKAVRDGRTDVVVGVADLAEASNHLASADRLVSAGRTEAFRAARGALRPGDGGVVLARPLAEALNASIGDLVRHVAF
ncbi:MAG: arginine N-succinyltransferase [Caulobacteraceae bacterium]|nr:arginine N-succinyltransferase [Caulobacteraceae bacterium]